MQSLFLAALPQSICESFSFDLGPTEGVFEPEFGLVGYDQSNKPGGGQTAESYGELVNGPDLHFNFFDVFAFSVGEIDAGFRTDGRRTHIRDVERHSI